MSCSLNRVTRNFLNFIFNSAAVRPVKRLIFALQHTGIFIWLWSTSSAPCQYFWKDLKVTTNNNNSSSKKKSDLKDSLPCKKKQRWKKMFLLFSVHNQTLHSLRQINLTFLRGNWEMSGGAERLTCTPCPADSHLNLSGFSLSGIVICSQVVG